MKKLEIIIKPEKLEDLKEVLDSCEVNGMNGKIFVYDVEDAVRIRTGEHGIDAL